MIRFAPPRRPVRWRVACLLAALAAGPACAAEVRLRILETTDLHMNLLNYDYYQDKPTDEYGLAKTITLIKAARAEARNSLLFDNGDLLQGNPLGDFVANGPPLQPGQVHPAYKVLNALGVDAANIGNHEFNYGLAFLRSAIAGAAFPYVSANVHIDDGDGNPDNDLHAFTPYVILERNVSDVAGVQHRLKIGVIGFVPPQILVWDRLKLEGKLTVRDIQQTARRLVPEMRAQGADIVVAIPHSGFERGETPRFAENSVARLAEVPGIDAILFGHSHGEFPGAFFANYPKVDLARGTINGVPAVMPGFFGAKLGVIDLVLDNSGGPWRVVDGRSALRAVFDRATRKPLVAADPMVAALIAPEHAATLRYVRGEVAKTSAPITSYFAQVADDPSVQLINNAQLHYARRALQGTEFESLPLLSAASPFKSGGRMGWTNYTDIPAGMLSIRHVADLYVYPNTIKAVRISGAQVREWLEMSAGQLNRIDPAGPAEQDLINPAFPAYNFDMIDGVRYQIDLTQPARYSRDGKRVAPQAHRIQALQYQGKPIDDAARFVVVTNNYRASGGGDFPGLDGNNIILDSPDENRQALIQYLRSNGGANDSPNGSTSTSTSRSIDPNADNNWRILPVPGIKLRFVSGAGAIGHLPRYPQITLVKDNGDGSALFELTP
jgi:2',3'-cyclic-nucleotide 2'-phosphodiesterase/3'-nucleotidase